MRPSRDYTRALRHGGRRRPLRVLREELDEALELLALELVARPPGGDRQRRARRRAGIAPRTPRRAAQGHAVMLRECPSARAAVYVPGRARALPEHGRDGVVTARAAGVLDVRCARPRARGRSTRSILAACRLCGVERVYRMGGAQAVAALAWAPSGGAR